MQNKLDGYIKEEESGKELSSDQTNAVSKYDEVVSQLGISKEFCKQIQVIATLASKEAKREARKATFLRQVQETSKVREVIILQDFLRQLKNECIRNDFLQGSNGACLIEVDEMNVLEQFSKYTIPIHPNFSNEPSFMNSTKSAADHLSFVVDGRSRQFIQTGFTYEKIKELFNRIQTCGYWEKDMKIVEEAPASSTPSIITSQERPAESETPQSSDDLESKDDKMEETSSKIGMPPMSAAPLPAQVPNPTQLFNGMIPPTHHHAVGVPMHMMAHHHHQQQQQQVQSSQQQQQKQGSGPQNMKTTVTAVENAFFNQMKYSQGPPPPMVSSGEIPSNANAPPASNQLIFEDFATANISFLQDSLVEQQQQQQQILNQASQPQQKMSNNFVSQPKPSPVQTQQQQQQLAGASAQHHQANSSFHHQQQQQSQTHHYPPGLKLQQNTASNIPGTFPSQPSQQAQTQQPNIPSHLIHQQKQSYQAPPQQYQQKMPKNIQNLQDIEHTKTPVNAHPQSSSRDDRSTHEITDRTAQQQQQQPLSHETKDKSRNNEWNAANNQQQPQIDTWNSNEAAVGNNNQGGNGAGTYSRFNRGRGSGERGAGGNPKFNNYR